MPRNGRTAEMRSRRRWSRLISAACALVALPAALLSTQSVQAATAASTPTVTRPVYAYYYLWWSKAHWQDMLGRNYPTTAATLPLPARLDSNGCNPVSLYSGNQLTDVPKALYSQDDPGLIESDVRTAAKAGLAGFMVNWAGSGSASQNVNSTVYNRRLQAMVNAVHKVNAEGIPFKLWLSYKASASILPVSAIVGDLRYFATAYAHDSAFDHTANGKPTVIWQGSRKYPLSALQTVSAAYRSTFRILGDETTWSAARGVYLDGDAYYWSSQNPWANSQSFQQLRTLASSVRASAANPDGTAKVWIAPVAPGYDKQLAGGSSCTPRKGGATLKALFLGNAATNPDAWGLISWNEITEGTYVVPMTRYGTQDLDVLRTLVS